MPWQKRRRKLRPGQPSLSALFTAILALTLTLAVLTPAPVYAAGMSYEDERKLGKDVFNYIKANRTILTDPEIANYINAMGARILKSAGPQPFQIRFFVLNDNTANAFAAPGGYIFINTGLIMAVDSEGQLAAIMSHELAHSIGRHIAERIAKSQKINLATLGAVAAGMFLGGQVGSAVALGSMAANIQAQLAYSREDETDADRKGLDYLAAAGYDPKCMIEAFRILLRVSLGESGQTPTYLKTHPGLVDRMGFVETWTAAHPAFGVITNQGDRRGFEAAKTRIMAHHADELTAYNYFQYLLNKDKTVWGHHGLALVYERQQKYEQAVAEFDLALKEEPANTEILTDYGSLLFKKGDYEGAQKLLGRVIILKPTSTRALFLTARILQERGSPERAKELYLRLLTLDPEHIQGLYNLGLVYGQMNELAYAHYNFGLHFKLLDQPDKAIYHLKKAREFASGRSPELAARIDQALEELKPDKNGKPGSPPERPRF